MSFAVIWYLWWSDRIPPIFAFLPIELQSYVDAVFYLNMIMLIYVSTFNGEIFSWTLGVGAAIVVTHLSSLFN